jgi:hypothetical protein
MQSPELVSILPVHIARLQCLVERRGVLLSLSDHPTDVQGSDKGTAVIVIPHFNPAVCLHPAGWEIGQTGTSVDDETGLGGRRC